MRVLFKSGYYSRAGTNHACTVYFHLNKLRVINSFYELSVKTMIWRNFCHFPRFQATKCTVCKNENFGLTKKYLIKLFFSNFFSKIVTFTKFLPKMCETKSQQFPHCTVSKNRDRLVLTTYMYIQLISVHFCKNIVKMKCRRIVLTNFFLH